ncbi:13998_t:CDS:2 [Cetraspora pellucida]|uniref:13998_t:CDS:1 n=1 Tax=Cetraspora pellucida TaxID=1433469 RepID=A0A9N9H4H4_9GLOM|nr:13998_t:CDS:2 [Cetraspora pellucida]
MWENEDWHIADGHPTNIAINAPNANNNTTVVVAGICFTPQQQEISLKDIQKAIQNALVQQKTENQTLVKKVTELESQMAKQTASQTVEPVKQPKGIFSTENLERNYSIKPFQRSYLQQSQQQKQSEKIDRIESKVDKISQITSQFKRMMLDNQSKKSVAKSNSTY